MTSKNSFRYINAAIKEANKSIFIQKHGSVIVTNGKIMSRGYNNHRNKSKDGFLKNSCTCHAEVCAIRNFYKIKKYHIFNFIKKGTIYVVRVNKKGELCSSAPCINCYNIISKVGIKKIVYSNSNGEIVSCYTKNYKIKHISYGQRYMIKSNILK